MLLDEMMNDEVLKGILGEGFEPFKAQCDGAMKFSFDKTTAQMAKMVADKNPHKMGQCLPFARLPFPITWIEIPEIRPLTDALRNQTDRTLGAVSRKGYLMVADDPDVLTKGVAYHGWKFNDPIRAGSATCMSMACMKFDWGEENVEREMARARLLPTRGREKGETVEDWQVIEAMRGILSFTPNIHVADKLERESIALGRRMGIPAMREHVKAQGQHNHNDWTGEPFQILSTIILINCKNGVTITPGDDLTRLNKRRVKRGKEPYYTHRTVQLHLRGSEREANQHLNGEGMRAHWVMGHPKVRKTGIFWWAPHMRGDESLGFADKDYEVTP